MGPFPPSLFDFGEPILGIAFGDPFLVYCGGNFTWDPILNWIKFLSYVYFYPCFIPSFWVLWVQFYLGSNLTLDRLYILHFTFYRGRNFTWDPILHWIQFYRRCNFTW